MFTSSKVDTISKLTFTKQDIQNQICEQLSKEGYIVTGKIWNETNSKLEVTAISPAKKGGK